MKYDDLIQSLKRNEFVVSLFETKEAAANYLNEEIDGKTVGMGDSETMLTMGLCDLLKTHNQVHDPMHPEDGKTFKIEPTLEKAVWRARNIAAPKNAMRHKKGTPCTVKGNKCYNCSHPGRICNSLVIHWNAMNSMADSMKCAKMEVVLIDESLGL